MAKLEVCQPPNSSALSFKLFHSKSIKEMNVNKPLTDFHLQIQKHSCFYCQQERVDKESIWPQLTRSSFTTLISIHKMTCNLISIYFFFLWFFFFWNAKQYRQAQARAHRIGQTQVVKVYRLLTKNTYEWQMFDRASKKLGLDQAVQSIFCDKQNGFSQVFFFEKTKTKGPI